MSSSAFVRALRIISCCRLLAFFDLFCHPSGLANTRRGGRDHTSGKAARAGARVATTLKCAAACSCTGLCGAYHGASPPSGVLHAP